MGDALGRRVMRLVRLSFADITTEGLRPGEYRELTAKELERLKRDFVRPHRARRSNARGEVIADYEDDDVDLESEDG